MSSVKVWRAADYVRMPWKNGGGSTEEITRDAGTGLDGFGWRLSIADIGESGGFSTFAGYQRVITVIKGAGLVLTVDGVNSAGCYRCNRSRSKVTARCRAGSSLARSAIST